MPATVYLNGRFMPLDAACVPVLDRGFLFGDGVYEVIPVYGGRMLRGAEHIERLERSMAGIRLTPPMKRTAWLELLTELVARNGGGDQSLYLQVTRGALERRDHAFPPPGTPPTVLAMSTPLTAVPEAWLREGVAAVTVPDLRWQRCDLKTLQLLPNVLARQQAVEQGAVEAILLREGQAIEGAASNLFVVRDGVVYTAPKSEAILGGITRDLVLELAQAEGIPVREEGIPEPLLRQADEVWLTSSVREILPVTRIDGRPVGGGVPGPLWRRMHAAYQAFKQNVREGKA